MAVLYTVYKALSGCARVQGYLFIFNSFLYVYDQGK